MELHFCDTEHQDLPEVVSWFADDANGFKMWTGLDFDIINAIDQLKQLPDEGYIRQVSVFNQSQALLAYYELHQHPDKVYLARFVINPNHRNKGLGKAVLQSVISASAFPIALIVYRANTAAIALYQQLGFQILDASDEHTLTLIVNRSTQYNLLKQAV